MKEPHGETYSHEQLAHLSLAQIRELRERSAKRRKRMRTPPLVPQERPSTLPLSYAQERLWFLDQLGLVGPAYNMAFALRLDGILNVPALERSFAEMIRRHESLRTRFHSVAGSPIQLVDPPASFALEVRDISELEWKAKALEVLRVSSEEARRPFDLTTGPLLRVSLLRLAQQEHVLLLTMHHIVSDGWSLGVLHRELGALYGAHSQGQSSRYPELPVQYVDYAIWQRQWLQGDVLQEQLQYWSERLAGAPPHLQLPTDRPRPVVASFKGAHLRFELPAGLHGALEKLARREGATLFMVVLAAFQVLLSRYSGQQDVVVGSGVAGRTHKQTEGLIGFFVNTLILRTDLSGNPTFRQLVERVKEVTLGAYAHQDLPFEKLVKELRPERNLSHQPVFQVALALQNFPKEQLELAGVTWTPIDAEHVTALFDLTLHLAEGPDGLRGLFEYATDLFDRETIERVAGHFRTLLEGVVADPDCAIEQLQVLQKAECDAVLFRFNDTATEYREGRLIQQLFEAQAQRTPEATAVVCGDQRLTYDQLNRRANQLSHSLVKGGVRPDERVCLYVERSVEMVVGLLGILKAGGAYVPLDVSYPTERLAYMLADSAPVMLLTQERLKRSLPSSNVRVIALDAGRDEIDRESDGNPDAVQLGLTPHHLAYVIYTSGSTGAPKGVMVSHRNVVNLVHWHCAAFDLRQGRRCSCVAAIGFDAAAWEIWPPLSVGATLVLCPPEVTCDAEMLLAWWANQPLDVSFLPTPVAELAFSRNILNERVRTLLVGGDRLRHRAPVGPCLLVNNYGPTESTVVATSGCIHDEDTVLHIGRPIANTQVYILDQNRRPAPIGAAGEIYIGGAGVARGYLNLPELTAERFVVDPFAGDPQARMYRSGDLGRWRSDGTIEYLGRNDHQVKIRGFRIELGEIESQLLRHSQVKEAIVLAREDEPGETRLVAYVTADLSQPKPQQDGSGGGAEIVAQWKTLYEQTYSVGEPGPSFVGWNSSYTGQPIPELQMEEWLTCAVERVRALQARKVLEIGCGVGLMLQRLAPQCAVYVGTDFSASALNQLRQWTSGRQGFKHVELLHRSATELSDMESGAFDLLVLNSVVQYFPDIEYLLSVLQEAIRLLGPSGKIFIGDVRHLGLLQMFHSAVQLSKAAATVSAGQLRRRIARAVAQEKELVIDPQFFQMLPGRLSGISAVDVQPKRGRAPNELTRYRYDVVLHVGEQLAAGAVCAPPEQQTDVGSIAELETALRGRRRHALRLRSVRNARLAREAAAQRLIETSDEQLDASALRLQLNELQFDGVDPEAFWELGQTHGYDVTVSWNVCDPQCFDVQLLDRTQVAQAPLSMTLPQDAQDAAKPWSAYANDPSQSTLRQQLIPELREYLKERLPDYMLPSAWVVLKHLPLTPHGKVDRRALPNPQERPEEMGEYVAPRTEVERALVDLWTQLLHVDQVGVQDNFFELGGHSLHGAKLIARVSERFNVRLSVVAVFQHPTIRQMAQAVESLQSAGEEALNREGVGFEEGVI